MAGWFVVDSDGYGLRFVGGADPPVLAPGETADFYGVDIDEQEVRGLLRRNVVGKQIGTGDGETINFTVMDAPIAHDSFTLYIDGVSADTSTFQWSPDSGALSFEVPAENPEDPPIQHPPPAGAILTADYVCLGRRPWAFLSLDKDKIDADGSDTATLTVTIEDPDEIGIPPSVTLEIMGAEVEVMLPDGEGEPLVQAQLPITAELPATIDITCPDKHVNPIPNRLEVRALG